MQFSFAVVAAVAGLLAGANAQYTNSTSVITVTSCVPTTYLSTITVAPTTTSSVAVAATSSVGTVGTVGTVASAASGTSSATISPSITPYTGAASNVGGSMAVAGLAAIAAIVLA